MSVHITEKHLEIGRAMVAEAEANDGLAPLDIEQFWADDEVAHRDPFADDCPQVPLGIRMSHECVFAELGIAEDWRRLDQDKAWALGLRRRYNDIAERIVERRLVGEGDLPDPSLAWPAVKGLHDIFEAENRWHNESYWIFQTADSPQELEALLDRVDRRLDTLREFLLPPNWDAEKKRLNDLGRKSPIYRGQRGPVTFATSIYGPENLIYLILDQPDLARRFSDTITRAILERARILDEERGWTPEEAAHGWYWCDDNCCLLNAEMYNQFAYPIMAAVYGRYCPDPGDGRGQHSDSDMAQHLPTFAKLGMNNVNFGPNLTVTQIREALPNAVIRGQLAPFTFSRDEQVNIVAETVRDCEMAREHKGLVYATAGSINNGSRLTGMRLIMATIQRHGRY